MPVKNCQKTTHYPASHTLPRTVAPLLASVVLALLVLLTACQIEGGVSATTTPDVWEPPTATPPPDSAQNADGSIVRIGLLDEPGDLLPYHNDAVDQRVTAPVSELLFPSPLLPYSYTYTTTGVLARVPSFENGDIVIQDVDVYIDAAGEIFTALPREITSTQQVTVTQFVTHTEELPPDALPTPTPPISPTDALTPTQPAATTRVVTETRHISTTELVTETIMVPVTDILSDARELGFTGTFTYAQQIIVTYAWNPELTWSDGVPVTADDSMFAYELAQKSLLGADANSRVNYLDRYEQVDDHTTRAYLKLDLLDLAGDSSDLPTYTDPAYIQTYWTPLPRHLLHDISAETPLPQSEFAQTPVGYGPYVVEHREDSRIRMRRNLFYTGELPQADAVSFVFLPDAEILRNAILAGSLDVAVADRVDASQFDFLTRDEQLGVLRVDFTSAPIWEHLDFNLDVPLLQDIRVRRAIAYGTNRTAMVDALFGGHVPVLHSWIVPESPFAADPADMARYPYDPAQAAALLNEAGLHDANGDGVRDLANGDPFSLTLLTTSNTPIRAEIARLFQQDMAALSVTVNVQTMPIGELYSPTGPLFRRSFELAQFAWIATPDPGGMALWGCRAVPDEQNNWQGNNFAGWCFRPADQAIRTATTSLSRTERLSAYIVQQQLLAQELPSLPLFQRLSLTLSRPELRHLRPDPIAPITWNMAAWRYEAEP